MSKHTFINRFSLIIKKLERGPATFDELKAYLQKESDIQDRNFNLSIRTLQRDIKDIYDQFQIEIVNERKGDKRYFIREQPDTQEHTQRLIEAYDMVTILKSSQQQSKYVFFDTRRPKGLEHFSGLLYACSNRKILNFKHIKFWNAEITNRTVHPLALKEARGRWYLVAIDTKDGILKTFGLDRMQDIDISKTAFREKYPIDISETFKHAFGILNEENQSPQKVVLSLSREQAQYLVNFPLHHSQELIDENEDSSVKLQLTLKISYDFIMELMSYGETIKVLSPKSLVTLLVKRSKKLIKLYE